MSDRPSLLVGVLVVQTALLVALVAERLVPEAHAAEVVRCEIANWPGALTGQGFDAVRVRVEEVRQPVPVVVKSWESSRRVGVSVEDWNTSDTVRVQQR